MKNANTAALTSNRAIVNAIFGVFAAILVLSYSAYAWFTMSTEVVARGINLTATAPDNILISFTGEDGTWSEKITISNADILSTYDYDTTKDMFIIPASSYAGFNDTFFQTNKSYANGQAMSGVVFDVATPLALYKDHYEGYYVDVPLYFKTTGGEDATLYLGINGADGSRITPFGDELEIYRTARVAFLNPNGEINSFGEDEPLVFASADRSPRGGVVTSSVIPDGDTVEPVFLGFDADGYSLSPIIELQHQEIVNGDAVTYPSQLILRIWIEGQDTYSTVAASGQTFNIDLKFSVKPQTP